MIGILQQKENQVRRPLVLLAIVLLASNCERKSTARLVEPPQNVVTPTPQRYIQGTVRLGDWSSSPGAPVNTAKVWLGSAYSHAVFSDTLGDTPWRSTSSDPTA